MELTRLEGSCRTRSASALGISQPAKRSARLNAGGKRRLDVGLPDKDEDNGKPDKGLSQRGFGTLQRTDPVYLGIQKTRLLDPTLNHLGTNDHPGDYRSSGCTGCHVIYANDRSLVHSSPEFAKFGNKGETITPDAKAIDNRYVRRRARAGTRSSTS